MCRQAEDVFSLLELFKKKYFEVVNLFICNAFDHSLKNSLLKIDLSTFFFYDTITFHRVGLKATFYHFKTSIKADWDTPTLSGGMDEEGHVEASREGPQLQPRGRGC